MTYKEVERGKEMCPEVIGPLGMTEICLEIEKHIKDRKDGKES